MYFVLVEYKVQHQYEQGCIRARMGVSFHVDKLAALMFICDIAALFMSFLVHL